MPTTSRRDTRLTYEDIVRMPEDGLRHEIIDGVHYVTPSPVLRHQQLAGRLHLAIGSYLEAHPEMAGVFRAARHRVFTLGCGRTRLGIHRCGSAAHIDGAQHPGRAGAGDRDPVTGDAEARLGIKRELFDRGGVREYWVVDPKARDLTVYRRTPNGAFPRWSIGRRRRRPADDAAASRIQSFAHQALRLGKNHADCGFTE